ncbi:alginate O-acetyltransferase AlgX-related protein [Shimia sp.]|uniref:alginate O-acetyltransferase AlgX-related protein n=1 Tax=Shimia sp. TaxID=1954381 RepID=UPI003BAA171E
MMHFNLAMKLTLPIAFFGYAVVANLALSRSDIAGPDFATLFDGKATQEIDGIYRDNLPHRSAAVAWIGAARYVLLKEGRLGVVPGQDGWLFTDEEFRSASANDHGLNEVTDWIASVSADLDRKGTQLVVVPLPAKLDIARDHSSNVAQSDAMNAFYTTFLAQLDAKSVAVVDTYDALLGTSDAFFQTDTHWTGAGADAVAKTVAESGLVQWGADKFEKIYAEEVTFSGDLISFVTSDALAPHVGLPVEREVPYSAVAQSEEPETGALDLFGSDGPTPYALVGTSYSANENWSFAEALKLRLRHDVLNFAEQGQGPIAPMRRYLETVSEQEMPETVLWEIPVRYLTDPEILQLREAGS